MKKSDYQQQLLLLVKKYTQQLTIKQLKQLIATIQEMSKQNQEK